jgi:hypothetical protein
MKNSKIITKAGNVSMNIIRRLLNERCRKEKQKELNRKFAEIMEANRSILRGYTVKKYDFGRLK